MLEFLGHPIVIALIVGFPSLVVSVLGYQRAVRLDEKTEKLGEETLTLTSVGHLISGQNQLIEALQKDNQMLRQRIAGVDKEP